MRRESPLWAYLGEIGTPTLTADEERELTVRVAAGDAEARERLALANLRMVVSAAGIYRKTGFDLDDLEGEGMLGLVLAIRNNDPATPVKFSRFAYAYIRDSIRGAIRRERLSRRFRPCDARDSGVGDGPSGGPRDAEEILSQVGSLPSDEGLTVTLLFGLDGRQPRTTAEAAKELGVKVWRVKELRRFAMDRLRRAMDAPVLEKGSSRRPTPEATVAEVYRLIADGFSRQRVADMLGVPRTTVNRLAKKAGLRAIDVTES